MDGTRFTPVTIEFYPKTYEIDFAGHVSNIVYIRWLEDLRIKWLDEYLPLEDQKKQDIAPTLLHTEIDYKRQIKLFDRPVIGTSWIEKTDRLRWTIGFEFTVNGNVMAEARQVGIFVKMPELKPIRLPKAMIDAIEDYKRDTGEKGE